MSTTADQAPEGTKTALDYSANLALVVQKLEEINCLLAAVDVIAKDAYERGVEAGRRSLAVS